MLCGDASEELPQVHEGGDQLVALTGEQLEGLGKARQLCV